MIFGRWVDPQLDVLAPVAEFDQSEVPAIDPFKALRVTDIIEPMVTLLLIRARRQQRLEAPLRLATDLR